ncbi:hypothetical protein HanRHA438_Chr06g0266551 [Helianthus annuus]|nr:hypothetical protein HanRHA438_Chr06g0266551 [Helianthus annuus]
MRLLCDEVHEGDNLRIEGVEILDNDNVGKGVEEYSAADMDGIREDWSTYAVNSIFKL